MSHYGVNTGVPKTLMQHLIRWVVSSGQFEGEVNGTLLEILDQEISPELVPTKEGERIQSTEDSVGPYALQDFTLFHVLRRGYRPSKIAFLAEHAWSDAGRGAWPAGYPEGARPAYDLATIRRWMEVFSSASSPTSSSARRSPTARRSSPAARCRRAATGGCRPTPAAAPWLAELEANVPTPDARRLRTAGAGVTEPGASSSR